MSKSRGALGACGVPLHVKHSPSSEIAAKFGALSLDHGTSESHTLSQAELLPEVQNIPCTVSMPRCLQILLRMVHSAA